MASIPTTSKQSVVLASISSGTDEENKIYDETDLSAKDTDIKINTDTSTWSTADRKNYNISQNFTKNISVYLEREPPSEL